MTDEAPRPRRWWRVAAAAVVVALVIAIPWWAPPLLARMTFFRVRKVEIEGARYLAPDEVVKRLALDTAMSVWDDLDPLAARVAEHPQVRAAEIDRRLPGTLVVRIEENLPVALVPASSGFHAIDAAGRTLPIDPSRTPVDLPIVPRPDSTLLQLLAGLREAEPRVFDRISEARRVGAGEVLFLLTTYPVRAMLDVSPRRLADIFPVEEDLARRNARITELDLRYRDQVIARVQ